MNSTPASSNARRVAWSIARRSIWRSLKALTAADPLAAQTQKNKEGVIDALYIFDIEMPDAVSEFIFWYCGDLINHEP